MALKVAMQNVSAISDLGNLPAEYTTQILRVVKTAEQLHTLEINSDGIYDETAQHWERLITRDYPILAARHNHQPKDRESWHEVYEAYKKLEDDQIAAATAKLSQSLAAKEKEHNNRRSTIVSAQKMPRVRQRGGARGTRNPNPSAQSWFQHTRSELRRDGMMRRHTQLGPMPIRKVTYDQVQSGGSSPAPSSPVIRRPRKLARTRTILCDNDDEDEATPGQSDKNQEADDDDLFGDNLPSPKNTTAPPAAAADSASSSTTTAVRTEKPTFAKSAPSKTPAAQPTAAKPAMEPVRRRRGAGLLNAAPKCSSRVAHRPGVPVTPNTNQQTKRGNPDDDNLEPSKRLRRD